MKNSLVGFALGIAVGALAVGLLLRDDPTPPGPEPEPIVPPRAEEVPLPLPTTVPPLDYGDLTEAPPPESDEPGLSSWTTESLVAALDTRSRGGVPEGDARLAEVVAELCHRVEGEPVPRSIVRRLLSGGEYQWGFGAYLLTRWDPASLIGLVADPPREVPRHAIWKAAGTVAWRLSHGEQRVPAAIPSALLAHDDPAARRAGLWLTLVSDEPDWDALRRVVAEDPAPQVRRTMVEDRPELVFDHGLVPEEVRREIVLHAVRDDDAGVRECAIECLPEIGEAALPAAAELVAQSGLSYEGVDAVAAVFVGCERLGELLALDPPTGVLSAVAGYLAWGEQERPGLFRRSTGPIRELLRRVGDPNDAVNVITTAVETGATEFVREAFRDDAVAARHRRAAVESLFPARTGFGFGFERTEAEAARARERGREIAYELAPDPACPAEVRIAIIEELSRSAPEGGEKRLTALLRKLAADDPVYWVRAKAKELLDED